MIFKKDNDLKKNVKKKINKFNRIKIRIMV